MQITAFHCLHNSVWWGTLALLWWLWIARPSHVVDIRGLLQQALHWTSEDFSLLPEKKYHHRKWKKCWRVCLTIWCSELLWGSTGCWSVSLHRCDTQLDYSASWPARAMIRLSHCYHPLFLYEYSEGPLHSLADHRQLCVSAYILVS